MTNITNYSKAIIAILGVGATAALGVVAPNTDLFNVLTIISAMLTAAGVYWVPNTNKKGNDFSDIELANEDAPADPMTVEDFGKLLAEGSAPIIINTKRY